MIAFNEKFHLSDNFFCSDKSLTHRAFILAAIADGECRLENVTFSRDICSTVNALRVLGAKIRIEGSCATVTPIVKPPLNEVTLDCGNSGTTARLLAGLVAGLGVKARFVGDESLSARPMKAVVEFLRALGADISLQQGCLFVCRGGVLTGKNLYAEVSSAQVKSAVVLAGLFAKGITRYAEKLSTRNHTEIMLANFGAKVSTFCENGRSVVTVEQSRPHSFCIKLPRDPSAVAYSVALALLKEQNVTFTDVLLNPARLGFYDVLRQSGAKISYTDLHTVAGEPVGNIVVQRSRLTPFFASEQDSVNGIDELPLLAAMALFVAGEHRFEGVAALRYKECDRIEAIADIICVCGQTYSYDGNSLTVRSNGIVPLNRRFRTFGDHRIAMCCAVLSVAVGRGCIDGAPFDVSDPNFLQSLGISPLKLGLIGSDIKQSVSPRLHTYLAMCAGVCCSYDIIQLSRDVSDDELLRIIDKYDGLNITMPFKTRVAQLLHSEIPAVNTVGKNIVPQSTDGYGLIHPLQKGGVDFVGQPMWIVGAGGAAESCVRELSKYGCKMQIINRTESHAEALRNKYDLPRQVSDPMGVLTFIPACQFERELILPESCKFVLIAAYMGSSNIRLQAEKRGLTVVDGLEMNYYQGTVGFSLWTDTPVQDNYEDYLKYIEEFDYI